MCHMGEPCWGEIWWLIVRQPSPCGSHAMCLDCKHQGTQQYMTTSPAPLTGLPVQKGAYSCKNTAREAEEGLVPSQMVKPSTFTYTEGAASQRYLLCYEKTICMNISPFWLSTFSALKLDSKRNLLLRDLLSALMHRAEGEAYSRGADFNHTHIHT